MTKHRVTTRGGGEIVGGADGSGNWSRRSNGGSGRRSSNSGVVGRPGGSGRQSDSARGVLVRHRHHGQR